MNRGRLNVEDSLREMDSAERIQEKVPPASG